MSETTDGLLAEILRGARGEKAKWAALARAMVENVPVPCAGEVAGGAVTFLGFGYDGDRRRGVTAAVRGAEGELRILGAAELRLADADGQRYIEAYRSWRDRVAPAAVIDLPEGNLEVAVLSVSGHTVRCRTLAGGAVFTLRPIGLGDLAPGEIATVKPAKRWTYGGNPYLSGSVEATRIDAKALGLTPLALRPRGEWDPAKECWGEPGEPVEAWAKPIIRRGKRPAFEMEQVIPGEDPTDRWSDPIVEAVEKKEAGDAAGAYVAFMKLCREDLRCLDAHTHLGNIEFHHWPEQAIRHYEVGVRIGELSLPEGFDGLLPWGWIDNRPFLRCLHGYALCLWRMERFAESAAALERILWLSPTDQLGVRFVIDAVRAERKWTRER